MKSVIFGKNKKFIEFLRKIEGNSVSAFTELTEAAEYALERGADVLFILPDYSEGKNTVDEFSGDEYSALCRLIKCKKTKIYIENYPSYDYRDCFVFGLQARGYVSSMGKNSICLCAPYSDELGFDILQKQSGVFYRCEKHTERKFEILAEVKNCLGVHKTVVAEEGHEGVALMKTEDGIYCSAVDITDLEDGHIFSYSHWRDFYGRLFGEILSVSPSAVKAAFMQTYSGIGTVGNTLSTDRTEAISRAILAALDWHEMSGIVVSEGRGGVYEMIRSFDLNIAKNIRGDSSLFTAALFMTAGKHFGVESYQTISKNILSYVFDKCNVQITEGENRGLVKWFAGKEDMGTRYVYVSDTSRSGNSLLALYKLTGDEGLKERVLLMGEAILRWFGGEAFFTCPAFSYKEDDLTTIRRIEDRLRAPEFYEAPLLFLRNLYLTFGDERYKEQLIKTAAALAEAYPNYDAVASHSKNFTYSRLLGAFAAAQSVTAGAWTPLIDELLGYFEEVRHECGGFAEGHAYFDKESIGKDMEFAVGFGTEDESIADIVYCQNTMLYTLNVLCKCKTGGFDIHKCTEMLSGLVDFILKSQIVSDDKRLSGGWMRAFDMDNFEYYGCDKDFAWGPYCILTGWVTGAIPLVLLDLLGTETVY